MLLNLSNHPCSLWTGKQLEEAKKRYGFVQDLPFPQIDPTSTTDTVRKLVLQYVATIRDLNPQCVHIQGEHTFTHAIVNRLQQIGIPCLASTTERLEELPDGSTRRKFQFVQFRPYLEI